MSVAEGTAGYVYLLEGGGFYKIGRSKRVSSRVKLLAIQLPYPVKLLCSIPCEDYAAAERCMHETYHLERLNGEWFDLSPEQAAEVMEIREIRGSGSDVEIVWGSVDW